MRRDELHGIEGLTDAQIEAIMALHGRDTAASNTRTTELQQQLTASQQQLATAQQQLTAAQQQVEAQKNAFAFETAMRRAARDAGATSEEDILALLPEQDKLRTSANQAADITAAIGALKQAKPYLFSAAATAAAEESAATETAEIGTTTVTPIVTPKPRTPAGNEIKPGDFVAMSGIQRMELRAKNPALFAQLCKAIRSNI